MARWETDRPLASSPSVRIRRWLFRRMSNAARLCSGQPRQQVGRIYGSIHGQCRRSDVAVGEPVLYWGGVTADDLPDGGNTNAYEVLTSISNRAPGSFRD
jgi:alanine racemase